MWSVNKFYSCCLHSGWGKVWTLNECTKRDDLCGLDTAAWLFWSSFIACHFRAVQIRLGLKNIKACYCCWFAWRKNNWLCVVGWTEWLLLSMVSVCGRQIGDCVTAAGFQSLALGFAVCSAGVYIASRLGPRGRALCLSITRKNKTCCRFRGQIFVLVLAFVCKYTILKVTFRLAEWCVTLANTLHSWAVIERLLWESFHITVIFLNNLSKSKTIPFASC